MTSGTKIQIVENRNLRFNFANGYTLSVSIGAGSYSENHSADFKRNGGSYDPTQTMEVAIMDSDGDFAVLPYDVAGWIPVSRLPMLITHASQGDWDNFLVFIDQKDEHGRSGNTAVEYC